MTTKENKFIELAEKRVTKTLTDIRLVGNLANRNNYVYTQEQANKICTTLENEIKNLKNKFKTELAKKSSGFKL